MSAETDREPVSAVASQAAMPAGAVFLSYASEDTAAAECIATALRNAGIEVWFDKSELRGGDAWDRQIREQIHHCRLFIPVISANSERRDEGYFRREWSLAADRTRDMAHKRAFLVPVVIDGTPERGASVPEKFHDLHWTRLPGGETSPAFVARIQKLLVAVVPNSAAEAAPTPSGATIARAPKPGLHPNWPSNAMLWLVSALLTVALAYLIADRFWRPQHSQATPGLQKTDSSTSANPSTAAAFNPPPHSIAVLPFVNMSGDKEQEYFSDGLSEELLNDLARIDELQVAARTSAFSFKGKDIDIGAIARKLNVGAVLEGSVRRSGHTIRVTAQLNNAVTGFHLWSQTYDRDLGDVLALQTDIANAVANALKVTLLGNATANGGTQDPAAFDAYLRAWKVYQNGGNLKEQYAALALYTEALQRDPKYALAFSGRSINLVTLAELEIGKPAHSDLLDRSEADARRAIALAPDVAEGHLALAFIFQHKLDLVRASEEYEHALTLEHGNARVLRNYSMFAVMMGHSDAGIAAGRRALVVDPLNTNSRLFFAYSLYLARRYEEALQSLQNAALSASDSAFVSGSAYYALGDFEKARVSYELGDSGRVVPGTLESRLAMVYEKLGRHADATAVLVKVNKEGNLTAWQSAMVYAQWGATAKALESLETAARSRDPDLARLRVEPLLDPLRHEPRFQAIERQLRFPD